MNNNTYTYAEVETALCLIEAILDDVPRFIKNYLAGHGIAQLRQDLITDCSPKLEAAYQSARNIVGEHGDCFDLEIVPAVLNEVLSVAGSHKADSDIWNRSTLKILWLSEFDNYLRGELKLSISVNDPENEELFTRWGQEGKIDYETAAKNYAYFLEISEDSESKNRLNVIYQAGDNQILSIHDTPTLCDEELSAYYRTKSDDHPSDRQWNQISVPFGVNHEKIIGSKISDWL